MAPLGMVDIPPPGFSSPAVVIISLVVFVILSITLLALCARCNRGSNAYDVSGTTHNDGGAGGAGGANGTAGTKSGGTVDPGTTTWRDHRAMPPNTLERTHAATH